MFLFSITAVYAQRTGLIVILAMDDGAGIINAKKFESRGFPSKNAANYSSVSL